MKLILLFLVMYLIIVVDSFITRINIAYTLIYYSLLVLISMCIMHFELIPYSFYMHVLFIYIITTFSLCNLAIILKLLGINK